MSNTFIPLYMADNLQQPEPGGSVGRGPTADHHTTEEHVQFQPPAAAVHANAATKTREEDSDLAHALRPSMTPPPDRPTVWNRARPRELGLARAP